MPYSKPLFASKRHAALALYGSLAAVISLGSLAVAMLMRAH